MSSYLGKYADYYDLIYADKPYGAEAAFLHECIKKYGGALDNANLLELACGSGRHAFALEQLGYSILATDYSEDLLNVARENAQKSDSQVEFRFADMRELDLGKRKFDTALCLFDAIGYVQTDEALKQVFAGVHRHLKAGDLFIFEFWHAQAMLNHYEPYRVRKWPLADGTLLRISETELMRDKGLAKVNYELYELADDMSYSVSKESQVNRFFALEEMKQFVEEGAFEARAWLNGYTWDETINDASWHVLCVAKAL